MTHDQDLITSYANRIRSGERPQIGKGLVDIVMENRADSSVFADCQVIMAAYPALFPLTQIMQAH